MKMKKTYQEPATSWTVVRTEEMISASIVDNGNGTLSVDLDAPDETNESSGNLSRQILGDEW